MRRIAILLVLLAAVGSGCSKKPQTFDQLKAAGIKAFIDKDYQQSRDLLGEALKTKASDRDANYFLAQAYRKDFFYDSALFYFKRVDLLFPDDKEVNRAIYDVAMQLGAWTDAKDAIQSLIQAGEPESQYLQDLAVLYGHLKNPSNVFYYRKKLLDREPDNPTRYIEYANAAAAMDSMPLAFKILDSAIAKFGPDEEFVVNKGMYYIFMAKYADAERIFRQVAAKDSTSVNVKLNLANALSSQDSIKKKKEALEIYRAIRTDVSGQVPIDSVIEALAKEVGE